MTIGTVASVMLAGALAVALKRKAWEAEFDPLEAVILHEPMSDADLADD
jgi:hypothetical protein